MESLENAGMSGGVVYNFLADNLGVVTGNDILASDIREQRQKNPDIDLVGAYTIVPSCSEETVPPDELPGYMKEHGFGCIRFNPTAHQFLFTSHVIGDYLETACENKIPVMFDAGPINHDTGITIEQADGILRDFPGLTAVLYHEKGWPNDRWIRPMLKQYKNLCVNTTKFVVDGMYENLVRLYGDERIIYGSSYPDSYMGLGVLMLKHAEIPDESKERIAGGNFLRLFKGWKV
jgi:predicted TIM-barrel fold metal-dependent hydrolase